MAHKKITFIHPVHVAFPFAILPKQTVSMDRFLSLLDGIDVDDRCELIECVEPIIGLTRGESLFELDEKLLQCRLFAEACRKMRVNESVAVTGLVQRILNHHFNAAWPGLLLQLVQDSLASQNGRLSCNPSERHNSMHELLYPMQPGAYERFEAFRRYNDFCDRVVGPLIDYS